MPKILPIITYPDKELRQKCKEVKKINDKIRRLIANMERTMLEKDGIGLAAPQVGCDIRVIIVNTKDGPMHFINPAITKKSWGKETAEEGCLSIPNFFGPVKRSKSVNVIYLDKENKKKHLKAEGLFARVIQQEVDHLNGVLFIDYLKKKDLKNLPRESE